ncbi:class I SAM-dependent methyltransferase [Candidatus Woesearchaeota archaeon]|nr:class I SAM-dependent methyltransferase [Candidatus Woesearchaeota archaeon]
MESREWDRVSARYFDEILSPFDKGVDNKVYELLEKVMAKDKSVLEVGCGMGFLIPFLSKNFRSVLAFDFSREMVRLSLLKHENLANVDILELDVLELDCLKQGFDVAVAVNSILMPDIDQVNTSLRLIHSRLNKGGSFIGVFPSIESALYEAMVTYEKEFERCGDHEESVRETNRQICRSRYDFCYGLMDFDGKQKHFYEFELRHRLKKAGFKSIRIGKLSYPWQLSESKAVARKFRGNLYGEPWDWTVVARK